MSKQPSKPTNSIFYTIKNSQKNVGIGSTQFSLETLFKLNQLWTIIQVQSIKISTKKSLLIITGHGESSTLFLTQLSLNYIMYNHNQQQRLQEQAINLLELIEDTSEHFCDEHLVSGEQFYVMMKALVDCKLKEFPLDFEQLEEDIYDD